MDDRKKFEAFILNKLQTSIKEAESLKKTSDNILRILSKSSPKLEGDVFYEILLYTGLDIDKLCVEYFIEKGSSVLTSLTSSENLFRNLISPHINSQNQFSKSSDIKDKRFNRLFSGELTDLYAHEVNDIAIALNTKPSLMFKYFYGNGERPIIGLAPTEKDNKATE